MSVVGPRPEVPRYVALYPADLRETVLSVRPGITDLASLAFRDESTLLARSADPERTYVEQILPTKLRYAQPVRAHAQPVAGPAHHCLDGAGRAGPGRPRGPTALPITHKIHGLAATSPTFHVP